MVNKIIKLMSANRINSQGSSQSPNNRSVLGSTFNEDIMKPVGNNYFLYAYRAWIVLAS
jgi:hypothetical protein